MEVVDGTAEAVSLMYICCQIENPNVHGALSLIYFRAIVKKEEYISAPPHPMFTLK